MEYKISNKIEKIDGMFDVSFNKENVTTLIIPKNITFIEKGCFNNFPKLKNLIFENGIKKLLIEDGCFRNCSNLSSIDFGNRQIEIGKNCFSGHSCKKILFGKNILQIGRNSFMPLNFQIEDIYFIFEDKQSLEKLDLKYIKNMVLIKALNDLSLDQLIEMGCSMKTVNKIFKENNDFVK